MFSVKVHTPNGLSKCILQYDTKCICVSHLPFENKTLRKMANFGAFKLIFEKCIHISSLATTSSPPHPYEREQNMGHVLSIKFIVFSSY